MVYLQDYMTRTPSLANPPVRTTPLGTRFTALLNGIPHDIANLRLRLRIRLHSWYLRRCRNNHEHAAALRAYSFMHIIRHRKPRHWYRQFLTTQWFQINWSQGF